MQLDSMQSPYWRISHPPQGVLKGNDGGTPVVLSEELWRNVRGTRLGGISRNRQAQGESMGRSGGKVVELCGLLSIPPVHCSGDLQGLSRNHGGIARPLSHEGEWRGLFVM